MNRRATNCMHFSQLLVFGLYAREREPERGNFFSETSHWTHTLYSWLSPSWIRSTWVRGLCMSRDCSAHSSWMSWVSLGFIWNCFYLVLAVLVFTSILSVLSISWSSWHHITLFCVGVPLNSNEAQSGRQVPWWARPAMPFAPTWLTAFPLFDPTVTENDLSRS
jgi:hypothetical protein